MTYLVLEFISYDYVVPYNYCYNLIFSHRQHLYLNLKYTFYTYVLTKLRSTTFQESENGYKFKSERHYWWFWKFNWMQNCVISNYNCQIYFVFFHSSIWLRFYFFQVLLILFFYSWYLIYYFNYEDIYKKMAIQSLFLRKN
jgi:hypothetical protein